MTGPRRLHAAALLRTLADRIDGSRPPGPVATCPCGHDRGRHYSGNGRCLIPECDCRRYTGPWPVDHLHVSTDPCPLDGQAGLHWGVMDGGRLRTVPTFDQLPGERP